MSTWCKELELCDDMGHALEHDNLQLNIIWIITVLNCMKKSMSSSVKTKIPKDIDRDAVFSFPCMKTSHMEIKKSCA